jgi:hypothetical protein
MSTESEQRPESGGEGRQPTEEELRAAYEAQIKQVRVEHILLEHVVTVANLGLRRTGLAPGTEDERDPEQVRLAVDSIRALLPLLERSLPEQAAQIRDALSQLEFAFLKIGGGESGPEESEPEPPKEPAPEQSAAAESAESEPPTSEDPGPAQRSGRLWVPGQ